MNSAKQDVVNALPDSLTKTPWIDNPWYVLSALILCGALLIYGNFNRPFYKFDDALHLRAATEVPLGELFTVSNEITPLPVSMLALRFDRALFGPPFSEKIFIKDGHSALPVNEFYFDHSSTWATGTRVSNALLHALAGFMLWMLLGRLRASPGIALCVAVAWTVHPMACESVCWISEMKNVLAALFGFLSLWLWSGNGSKWYRSPAAAFMYLLACLSKPTALGLLPIFFALEYFFLMKKSDVRMSLLQRIRQPRFLINGLICATPLLAITLSVLLANLAVHTGVFVEHAGGSMRAALMTDFEIFWRYICNIATGTNLSMCYGIDPIVSFADPRLWLYGCLIVVVCAGAIWAAQGYDRKLATLGIIWFFAALGPTSNIAPIAYWMQDRYAYISAAGLLLTLICGAKGLLTRSHRAQLSRICAALFLSFLALMSILRSPIFADSDTFFMDAATREPLSGSAQLHGWKYHSMLFSKALTADVKREEAALSYYYFERALKCPDLTNFKDEFEMRVTMADLLMAAGQIDLARGVLDGWVPPSHMQMRQPDVTYTEAALKSYYQPGTLALAWLITSDIHIREAAASVPNQSAETFAKRKRLCGQALEDLGKAAELRDWKKDIEERRKKIEIVMGLIEKDEATFRAKTKPATK